MLDRYKHGPDCWMLDRYKHGPDYALSFTNLYNDVRCYSMGPGSVFFLIDADGSIFYNAEPKDKKYIEGIFSDKKLHFFTSVFFFLSFYDFCYQNLVYI